MGAGLAERPPCLPHSQVLMGDGLAGRPPCLPHSQVLMDAGLRPASTKPFFLAYIKRETDVRKKNWLSGLFATRHGHG